MQTYEIIVRERSIVPNSDDMTLVRTSIGIDQLHILLDNAEWLEFPISCTFAQGSDIVTIPLTVRPLEDSEWVAESTCTIPYEVIDMVGPIRVTLQGVDSNGRHIITAKGSPLSVEEAGDVVTGGPPSDAPTTDQWQQVYSDAQAAVNEAVSALGSIDGRIADAINAALESYDFPSEYTLPIATDEVLGGVKIGSGISYADDGTIFVTGSSETPVVDRTNTRLLNRIAAIVDATISPSYDDDGNLTETKVSSGSIPIATMDDIGGIIPDGTSVVIDDDGMIHAEVAYIPIATSESPGQVKPDGTTITVDSDGTIHSTASGYELPVATTESLGGVIPDGTSITIDEDGTIHGSAGATAIPEEEIATRTPLDDPIPDGDIMSW